MTTVSKLGIQGIRSFDHERLEVVDFEKPVTLIVGPNGSGKTTIIECLKMASAGALPPNSKNGHGFIHDPQVAHLPEVKAQIRMLFKTGVVAREKEICAIRSFQLTNKKMMGRVKPVFKALESVLRTQMDDGTKASLSHRCADMDTQVPELMGVSKAVLENVIFCHQEDSSWPLAESTAVKKRFDDIFGATKYSSALANIKILQREWHKKSRDHRSEADLTQAHVDQATKLKSQRDERARLADELTTVLTDLDTQSVAAEENVQRAQIELAQYESRGVRIQERRSVLQRIEQDRFSLVENMKVLKQEVYRESYEELQQQAQQFEEKVMCESEQKVRQAKTALTKGESDYHTAVSDAHKLRNEISETVASADLLASKKKELSDRLRQADQPSVTAMKAKLDAMAAEFAHLEREQRQRDSACEEKLAAAENAHREATLEASRNESRAEDAIKAIRRLEEEQKTLARAPNDLEALVRSMRENEATLGAEGSDAKLLQLEKRQEEIGRRRHDLQYSISRKTSEVAQLEAFSDAHVEVDALRKRLRDAEGDLSTKVGNARARLTNALGQMPEAVDAETKVLAELQQTEELLKRQRRTLQDVQQRQSGISARRSTVEMDLRRLQTEEANLVSELNAGVSGGASSGAADFVGRLEKQREQVELYRKDLAMTESAQHMYEKFREKSRTKDACQFCRRGFCSAADRNAFEESVERLIVKIPSFLEESRRRLGDAQAELSRLEGQRPRWERLEQLRLNEIPQKQKDLGACSEEEKAAQAALDPQARELRRLEERVEQLQNLRADAAALHQGARTVDELSAAVRQKEARALGGNSKVSLQAERDQLRLLQEQLCELGREEDAVRTNREMLAKQQEQVRRALAEQKGKLQLLQAQAARRGDVDSELAARQADHRECSEVARRSRSTAEAAAARAKELRSERETVQASFRRDLDSRDAQVRALQREVDSLAEMEKSIDLVQGRVENVDVAKAKLASAEQAVRTADRELEGLRAKLESEEEKRRKREEVHKCLQTNLKLKSLEAEIQREEAEIAQLLRELGGRDLESLKREVDALYKQYNDLQKQKSFREGELTQTRESLRALEVEIAGPLYHGIDQRHREAMIKNESAALATRDLGRYHGALDRALMKFHTLKMTEINKSIKELWSKVYRGRDIDYIAVRSDADEAEEGGGTPVADVGRATRSYNYRVVMVCGEAEMDMRGRCSAGQRVLASLIIRLALADSFCVNCGILALDEPTTNLDAANIRGLAEALAALIESRRRHSHFQLILITHDEAFVNQLCRLQVSDWFYQIRKDETGCSKIERQDIRMLTG
jgi:DNA repair protein RAD50